MKATGYFTNSVLARRPYLKMEWIEHVLANPIRQEVQPNGRIRRWARVSEIGNYLRVVAQPDGETVHNAFLDRGFKPGMGGDTMRFKYHPDSDMLHIQLADRPSAESEEVGPGIVLDFDEDGRPVGIEIEDASTFMDLSRLEVLALPVAHLILDEKAPAAAGGP